MPKECSCAVATSDSIACLAAKFVRSHHCKAAFFLQVPKKCTNVDLTLLYILIWGTYTKFIRENKMLMLSVCLPQPCSSDGRCQCLPCQDHVRITTDRLVHFHKIEFNEMPCKLDFTENPRSFEKYPTNSGLRVEYCSNKRRFSVISRTSLQSIQSSLNSFWWKRTNWSLVMQTWSWHGDLNVRLALELAAGSKCHTLVFHFFHRHLLYVPDIKM